MSRREKNKKRNSLLKLLYINHLRRKRRLWSYEWLLDIQNKYAGASNLLKEL